MGKTAWHSKMYTNVWTDLNLGRQLLMMSNDQASLQHHKQMTTVLKWIHWLKKIPSDCHVFGPLREVLHVQRYANDYEDKDTVHTWLWSQPKNLFADGIRRLENCYKICAEKRSDYVEILYTLYLSQIAVHEVINIFTLFFDSSSYDIFIVVFRID